ncbi:hypothetical protein CR513_50806, partial [Mucuna pruriens]
MDIRPAYSCLLGRPCIHAVGAVKFIADQQLISAMGEKELIVTIPLPVEYVEGDEEVLLTSFQALEIVGTTSSHGHDSQSTDQQGFQPGKGLGKGLDSMTETIVL